MPSRGRDHSVPWKSSGSSGYGPPEDSGMVAGYRLGPADRRSGDGRLDLHRDRVQRRDPAVDPGDLLERPRDLTIRPGGRGLRLLDGFGERLSDAAVRRAARVPLAALPGLALRPGTADREYRRRTSRRQLDGPPASHVVHGGLPD